MRFYSVILAFTFSIIAFESRCMGQTVTIKVKDTANTDLVGTQVQLTKLKDSVKVVAITNLSGVAAFTGVANGLYKVRISYVGYLTLNDTINVTAAQKNFEFKLTNNAMIIDPVVVTAKRALIHQEDDKIIVDPQPLVSSSTNALEVLEKTPGLYVDQDGGIYLTGTTPASIYINGREQKMSSEDITTLLKSLPPGSIQKIEILRTPSTKYDASSSGGIINIVLNKGVNIGQAGSINIGMNQGFYGNRFAGFTINKSGDKSTSYLNVNYNHNGTLEEINSIRFLNADTLIHQSSDSKQYSEQGYLGYGISYDASKKLTLSYDGRLNLSFPKSSADNINMIKNAENTLLAETNNHIDNSSKFVSLQQDLGVIRKFDTLGSQLDTKFSYSFNSNNTAQDYLTNVSFPINMLTQGNGDNKQFRNNILFQSDLTWFLPLKIKLETGIQASYQYYSSNADYFLIQNDSTKPDPKRTNAFTYLENINAAYAQASRTFGKLFTLKAGIRMEQTYMKGHQTIPTDTSFIVNRADWFPYVYLSRRIIHIMGIDLFGYMIYRKTITRPGYQSLNPYIKYVDEFLYETGNPALRPQFTDNVEVNISYNDMPVFAVGQNFTRDIFSSVIYKDNTQQAVAVRTYDNLGKDKETYFRSMVGIPPGGKYFFAIGAQYSLNEYNGYYENQPLNYKRGSWRYFTFHSLSLFKQTKLNMYGFMMVNGFQNFYELKNFGQLNFSLTQTLLKKKLTITLNARDVLRTMKTEFTLNQGSINSTGDRYTDNRRFGINIRYNFGVKKKDEHKGIMPNEPED